MTSTPELVRQLQNRIRGLEKSRSATLTEEFVSSGCPALDRLFPEGGLRRGSLVEWLTAGTGSGPRRWPCFVPGKPARTAVPWWWSTPAPGVPTRAAAWGLDLQQVILLYPATSQDECWAWTRRCGVREWRRSGAGSNNWTAAISTLAIIGGSQRRVGVADPPRPGSLAADVGRGASGGGGARVVPPHAEPLAAGRRFQVRLLHGRGSAGQGDVQVALDEWTGELREVRESHATATRALAAQLARATTRRLPTGTCGAGGGDL